MLSPHRCNAQVFTPEPLKFTKGPNIIFFTIAGTRCFIDTYIHLKYVFLSRKVYGRFMQQVAFQSEKTVSNMCLDTSIEPFMIDVFGAHIRSHGLNAAKSGSRHGA